MNPNIKCPYCQNEGRVSNFLKNFIVGINECECNECDNIFEVYIEHKFTSEISKFSHDNLCKKSQMYVWQAMNGMNKRHNYKIAERYWDKALLIQSQEELTQ